MHGDEGVRDGQLLLQLVGLPRQLGQDPALGGVHGDDCARDGLLQLVGLPRRLAGKLLLERLQLRLRHEDDE